MAKRPFRADHVGSMLRPDRLIEAREKRDAGSIDPHHFREIEDACVLEAIRLQEDAGMRSITDGEMRRGSWSHDFLTSLDNVHTNEGRLEVYFTNADGSRTNTKPIGVKVTGKVARSRPIQLDSFLFLKEATRQQPKVCIPSPTLLHFRNGREDVDRVAYPEMREFFSDIAKAYQTEIDDLVAHGLTYLQIDDTNLAYLCAENFRDAVRKIGEDPDALPRLYVDLINACLATVPPHVTVTTHLCRGNFSTGGASGGYEPVAETLFGGLNVDGFFLEFDDTRSGGFEPLRFLPKNKTVALGLMTTKNAQLETKDELKRRIDQAARVVPLEQLALCPQCGFSSGANNVRRKMVSVDDERAKFARLVETALDVWGEL